jgi:glutamate synthase domain-containing protein 1
MKFLKYLLVFTIVLTSCKTKKVMIDTKAIPENMSARKVAKKHIASNFDKKTLDAKLKVNFNNGKTKQSLSVRMKIKKDEVIWLSGSKIINVFKAEITPTSVRYYSSLFKNYFEGDFSMIKELLGVEINFEQLQNLSGSIFTKRKKRKIRCRNCE